MKAHISRHHSMAVVSTIICSGSCAETNKHENRFWFFAWKKNRRFSKVHELRFEANFFPCQCLMVRSTVEKQADTLSFLIYFRLYQMYLECVCAYTFEVKDIFRQIPTISIFIANPRWVRFGCGFFFAFFFSVILRWLMRVLNGNFWKETINHIKVVGGILCYHVIL